jgi:hypothetical protein
VKLAHRSIAVGSLLSLALVGTALAQAPTSAPRPAAPTTSAAPPASAPPAGSTSPVEAPVDAAPGFPAPLAESLEGEAGAAYESALLLYRSGDMATAHLKFEEAYTRSSDPRLLWNMAACQRGLRKYAKVERLVRRYLAEAGTRLSPEERAEADRSLEALAPLVAPLETKITPAGAALLIDGERVGTTPLAGPINVEVGPHLVRVEREGFEPAQTEITVGRERANLVSLGLKVIPKEGHLVVAAPTGASIFVDGERVGLTRHEAALPPGTYRVRVEAEGYQPSDKEVAITAGSVRSLDVALTPIEGGVPTWAWIGGGTLVTGGLVVAAIFLFQPADPIQPAGNFDPGNVVVYPAKLSTPATFQF